MMSSVLESIAGVSQVCAHMPCVFKAVSGRVCVLKIYLTLWQLFGLATP